MPSNIYIFAGGGTGGHLCPGLAVAKEVTDLDGAAAIVFACSRRPIDRRILDPLPYAIVPQAVRPLPRAAGAIWPFLRAWSSSKAQAAQMIRDLRPAAVLGLGGFAAAPVVRAAAKAGVATALLNPDAVPGKANRYLAGRPDVIFTQFEATAEAFGHRVRDKVRCVGCPVRQALLTADRGQAEAHFDLLADRKTILVLGGSQGAETINAAVAVLATCDAMAELAEQWQILHITGPAKDYRPPNIGADRVAIRRLEYCQRMDLAYAAADLAVCRGGASTVAELAATATPAVILPYPHHADRQQWLNAAALAEAGGAVICEDARTTSLNVAALRSAMVPILQDGPRLAAMQAAARSAARPDAARQVANWLVNAAAGVQDRD